MSIAVLHPEDCLKHPFSKQALISPPRTAANFPKNTNPNRPNRSPVNRKKRATNTSPPSRPVVDQKSPAKNLLIGQVKILKRGEELVKPAEEPIKVEKKKVGNGNGLDLASTNRSRSDPISIPSQIRLTESNNKISAFYAGSAFFTSPPPSSVPLPAFFTKKCPAATKTVDPTTDLRRILRLDL